MAGSSQKFWKPSSSFEDDAVIINPSKQGSSNLSLSQQRQLLPIFVYREHLLYALENYQTVVVISETGTGKSTQIPQYLLEAGWNVDNSCIVCTQPRRIAAISLANRVAQETGTAIGNIIGYNVRFDAKFCESTAVKYVTDGVLLRETLSDPLLSQYSVIMVDEAHERSLHTDILLGILKKILRKRPTLRLIIASATIDALSFKEYFELSPKPKNSGDLAAVAAAAVSTEAVAETACIINVPGKMYPVDCLYLEKPTRNIYSTCVSTVISIHKQETIESGDILVFLPGGEEIDTVAKMIDDEVNDRSLICIPLYSTLPYQMQMRVFQRVPSGCRKVIIATNIAETSLTIDNIRYVVDSGFVKQSFFNPVTGIECLVTCPVSRANAQQRAGRAGRLKDGKCFRLMTESSYLSLEDHSIPEMQRSDVTSAVLQLKALGISDIAHFDYISPPAVESMLFALELLYSLNAIDEEGKLSYMGECMSEMPIEPRLGRCLLQSIQNCCELEMAIVASMCSMEFPYIVSRGVDLTTLSSSTRGGDHSSERISELKQRLLEAMAAFTSTQGDHLTLLNIYKGFETSGKNQSWCDSMCLQFRVLTKASEIFKQLSGLIRKYRPRILNEAVDATSKQRRDELSSCFEDTESLLRCILSGYFNNVAQLHSNGIYYTIRGKSQIQVHYTSDYYRNGKYPEWVLYHESIASTVPLMRIVSKVNPLWILQEGQHYYAAPDARLIGPSKPK